MFVLGLNVTLPGGGGGEWDHTFILSFSHSGLHMFRGSDDNHPSVCRIARSSKSETLASSMRMRRRDIAFTNAKMAFTRGVRIVLGTNASVLPNRRNARELCALVEIGMTPAQAVRAATIDAGELLGWKVGRIQRLLNSQFECLVPRLVHTCQMKPDKSRRR